MHPSFVAVGGAVPIHFVHGGIVDAVLGGLSPQARAFTTAARFESKPGKLLLLPGDNGALARVLFGLEAPDTASKDLFRPGSLAMALPAGTYRFANAPHDARLAALAIALGSYQFSPYRKAEPPEGKFVWPTTAA